MGADVRLREQAGDFRQIDDAVEVAASPIVVVDDALIDRTIARARRAPRGRARVLLHPGADDLLHEMVIALPRESCDVPHINFKSGKSFHVLRGEMAVMVFADDGSEVRPVRLGESPASRGRMVRLNEPRWHTIIPLSDGVVFVETIIGPFTGNRFAPWSPDPGQAARWTAFADSLRRIAASDEAARPALG